jgi:hypothetical protein
MADKTLLMFNPGWEEDLVELRATFRAQWQAARREPDAEKRGDIKKDCHMTLDKMRMIRMSSYRTPAEAAVKALAAVRLRALRRGLAYIMLPDPAKRFETIADIRGFLKRQNHYISAHEAFIDHAMALCPPDVTRYNAETKTTAQFGDQFVDRALLLCSSEISRTDHQRSILTFK